jgi:hypothetical protein
MNHRDARSRYSRDPWSNKNTEKKEGRVGQRTTDLLLPCCGRLSMYVHTFSSSPTTALALVVGKRASPTRAGRARRLLAMLLAGDFAAPLGLISAAPGLAPLSALTCVPVAVRRGSSWSGAMWGPRDPFWPAGCRERCVCSAKNVMLCYVFSSTNARPARGRIATCR